MKNKVIVFLSWFVLCTGVKAQVKMLDICPEPASCEIISPSYLPLNKVSVASDDKEAVTWVEKHLKAWYGKMAPEVLTAERSTVSMSNEEYKLEVKEGEVQVTARTLQGVRYALYSLRQIAIPKRDTKKVEGWIVPQVSIKDQPGLSFRGIHICWFHETEPWEIERLIRLAAYYKLNYAVVESWGTFRSDVAPWYGWPDGKMTKKEIKRLKRIADDLGITLIPQINTFGHATSSRGNPGKHASLEFSPEYQPLFEPLNGGNWCISNPETRKLLTDLIAELHEAFGNPPYFHIGGDEASQPTCPECTSRPYSQLFLEHIKALNKAVSARGAKTMMWHDMLLQRGDERWNGFYAFGTPETAKGFLDFPRDIIICDWYYGGAKENYPTMDYFKSLGFSVLTCPWHDWGGTLAQGRYAHKTGMNGILGTTWHHYFGDNLINNYFTLSNVAWNAQSSLTMHGGYGYRDYVLHHLRQIGWDMKTKDSRHTGTYYHDIPPEPFLND